MDKRVYENGKYTSKVEFENEDSKLKNLSIISSASEIGK